jgi:hypothetical protein
VSDPTIIGAAFAAENRLRPLLLEHADPGIDDGVDAYGISRVIKIRAARTAAMRDSASTLINLRYGWRGYATKPLPQAATPDRITLVATDGETTIGTMSVGFGGDAGLLAEELFPDEVHALRLEGHRICEFTQLALDNVRGSKRLLASLFHVAYIYSFRVMGFDRLLIEVNPRHVNYYRRILGFTVISAQRMNPRVKAPAILMCLDFMHTQDQIGKFGGRPELAATERSLYPLSFSIKDEAGIAGRLGSVNGKADSDPIIESRSMPRTDHEGLAQPSPEGIPPLLM